MEFDSLVPLNFIFEKTNDYYFILYLLTMKTLNLHTNCYQPQPTKVWADSRVFNSERIGKLGDIDLG